MTAQGDDATVLRAKSRTNSTGGSGEAAVTPRVLKSRFVLDERLGAGGMGTVYRAKDLRKVEARDRFPYVAIKVLNSDVREHPEAFIALEREASKSQQLSHPNIVSIFDFDKDGNVPFITMELLQGRELADLLHAYPNGLPDKLAWEVIAGLCSGLKHAHDNGVVHADFKPGNVFVTAQDVAKILDFGIARAVQVRPDHGEDTVFDPARMAALTPVYASLEMIRGDNPEQRDDIYSLGIVIYMILTGHHPYGRLSADEALAEGLEPERPKNLSMRQWRALSSALSFHRQGRPASVADLEHSLLGQVPWRSRALAAAAFVVALFAGSVAVIEGSQIEEVKEEVRQTTLLDAQAARVAGLVVDAPHSEQWMATVETELARLASLDGSDAYHASLKQKLVVRLQDQLEKTQSWAQAVPIYQLIRKFENSQDADRQLRVVVQDEASRLSSIVLMSVAGVDTNHRQAVQDLLALADQVHSVAPHLTEHVGQKAVGITLGDEALRVAQAGQLTLANDLLALAEPLAPQADRLALLHTIADAEAARALAEQQAAATAKQLDHVKQELGGSCLRLQLDGVPANSAQPVIAYVDQRVASCVTDLSQVDVDHARALQREARERFNLPLTSAINLDPCRNSPCRDALPGGFGPQLVVVSSNDGAPLFAVTQEISGEDFAAFCATTDLACAEFDISLPVTGLAPALVERFARWMSDRSGYHYRLPSEHEWVSLGQSADSGTVNCGGGFLSRRLSKPMSGKADERGLHHVLGNAAELVRGDAGYLAAGGSVRDGGRCSVSQRVKLDQSDGAVVGFRLLRELT